MSACTHMRVHIVHVVMGVRLPRELLTRPSSLPVLIRIMKVRGGDGHSTAQTVESWVAKLSLLLACLKSIRRELSLWGVLCSELHFSFTIFYLLIIISVCWCPPPPNKH